MNLYTWPTAHKAIRMHSSNHRSHSGVSYSLCVSHSSRSDPNLCRSQLFTALSIIRPSFHPKSSPRSNNRKVIGRTRRLSHARDRSKAHISSNGTDALPSSTRSPKLTEALQSRGLFIHQLLSNYIFIAPTIPGRDSNSSFAQAINKSLALSLAR